MTRDRAYSDEFELTHQAAAHLLGVRRESISESASVLRAAPRREIQMERARMPPARAYWERQHARALGRTRGDGVMSPCSHYVSHQVGRCVTESARFKRGEFDPPDVQPGSEGDVG
jgi:hypothetical protein